MGFTTFLKESTIYINVLYNSTVDVEIKVMVERDGHMLPTDLSQSGSFW